MSADPLAPAEPIVAEPIIAEIVPPPRPMQFGLRTLLLLMAVCSVQFAFMSYAGVLPGIVLGLFLACAAFAGVFLIGVLPGVFAPQQVRRLDQAIVWLMVTILTLFFGTLLAGGGVAVWETTMRIQNEAWLERSIGAGLSREMMIEKNEPKWVLRVTSIRTGSPADVAGLRRDEVLLLDTTVDQFYKSLQANRGNDVELTVAICSPAQPLDKAVRRTEVLSVPK